VTKIHGLWPVAMRTACVPTYAPLDKLATARRLCHDEAQSYSMKRFAITVYELFNLRRDSGIYAN